MKAKELREMSAAELEAKLADLTPGSKSPGVLGWGSLPPAACPSLTFLAPLRGRKSQKQPQKEKDRKSVV